jgi:hypothetical protein
MRGDLGVGVEHVDSTVAVDVMNELVEIAVPARESQTLGLAADSIHLPVYYRTFSAGYSKRLRFMVTRIPRAKGSRSTFQKEFKRDVLVEKAGRYRRSCLIEFPQVRGEGLTTHRRSRTGNQSPSRKVR